MDGLAGEKRVAKLYARFASLAERYHYTFSRPCVTAGGVPVILFLGNHSSGKSSLINGLLGEPSVQDTGVAPTDDGFTLILWGEQEEDVCGPAALARLPAEFKALEDVGPALLRRLRVKVRRREILRQVILVDSPGMIDAAEGANHRDYDFAEAVRRFAEIGDLVFFLFDPEKPGTTGETVNVFAKSLRGMEFKLRVLLNKCDTFAGIYDFARAYGTLCWNLAHVLRTKDLPKIFTVYTGTGRGPAAQPFAFTDFDRHRAEFQTLIRDAGARRTDSVHAAAKADFAGLSLRMRVLNAAARRLSLGRVRAWAVATPFVTLSGVAALAGAGHVLAADLRTMSVASVSAAAAGVCVCAAAAWVARWGVRLAAAAHKERLVAHIDDLFSAVCRTELATGKADDCRQVWEDIRAETADVLRDVPLCLPWFGERRRAALDAARATL